MKSVLVVCEGNICRSPMAQAMFANALPNASVLSAGLGALIGMPADTTAVRLMRERGFDLTMHRAQQISRFMCTQADLVFVMESSQQRRLQELFPQVRGRVFRLAEKAKADIPDPYQRPEQVFRDALVLIEKGVHDWLRQIERI